MKELRLIVNMHDSKGTISKNLYGQFLEQTGRVVYDGVYVGEASPIPNRNGIRLDVLEALRDMRVPLLHWPGGYTAEFYHWRNGIGPQDKRPVTPDHLTGRISRSIHQQYDSNAFGTHEFLNLCEELGADPYVVFGSGQISVEEMHDWMEYATLQGGSALSELRRKNGREEPWNVRYLTIGNEWWFYEDAASYAVRYRRGIHFARNFLQAPFRIVRGPQIEDIHHTDALVDALPPGSFDGFTVYIVMDERKFGQPLKALDFSDEEYIASLQFLPYVKKQLDRHLGVIRKHPKNDKVKLCVDEWGCWHDTTADSKWYMHTTMRDAVLAAGILNIFNNMCDSIEMASLAMGVNALHAVLQTHGAQLIKTPTFYVFRQYREHQNARQVFSYVEEDCIEAKQYRIPAVSHSASVKDGKLLLSLVNCFPTESVRLNGRMLDGSFTSGIGEVLCADPRTENTPEAPNSAVSRPFTDFVVSGETLCVTLPPCSVVTLTLCP